MEQRLECVEGNSSKFWQYKTSGRNLKVEWGRLGTKGQSKTYRLGSPSSVVKKVQKLTYSKLNKGYDIISSTGTGGSLYVEYDYNKYARGSLEDELEKLFKKEQEGSGTSLFRCVWDVSFYFKSEEDLNKAIKLAKSFCKSHPKTKYYVYWDNE
jgi:predicted DNA-binding WGR domain protein